MKCLWIERYWSRLLLYGTEWQRFTFCFVLLRPSLCCLCWILRRASKWKFFKLFYSTDISLIEIHCFLTQSTPNFSLTAFLPGIIDVFFWWLSAKLCHFLLRIWLRFHPRPFIFFEMFFSLSSSMFLDGLVIRHPLLIETLMFFRHSSFLFRILCRLFLTFCVGFVGDFFSHTSVTCLFKSVICCMFGFLYVFARFLKTSEFWIFLTSYLNFYGNCGPVSNLVICRTYHLQFCQPFLPLSVFIGLFIFFISFSSTFIPFASFCCRVCYFVGSKSVVK